MAASPLRPASSRDADVLVEVLERLARIERRLEHIDTLLVQRPRRRSPRIDGELLDTIHRAIGSVACSAGDLMARAAVDAVLHKVFATRRIQTATDLGVRLRSLCGRPIGELTLERIGRDRGGVLWTVVKRV